MYGHVVGRAQHCVFLQLSKTLETLGEPKTNESFCFGGDNQLCSKPFVRLCLKSKPNLRAPSFTSLRSGSTFSLAPGSPGPDAMPSFAETAPRYSYFQLPHVVGSATTHTNRLQVTERRLGHTVSDMFHTNTFVPDLPVPDCCTTFTLRYTPYSGIGPPHFWCKNQRSPQPTLSPFSTCGRFNAA